MYRSLYRSLIFIKSLFLPELKNLIYIYILSLTGILLSFFFCLNLTEPSFATSASIGISGDANVEQDNPVTSKTLKKTIDINVSTNSYTGYELLMSSETNQNNLIPSKTDNHSHIDSVSADTNISSMHNQYGYNVKDTNDDIYSAIPKLSTPLKIKTNPAPATETVKFNLGFGLDNNLPTDNYKNKLIFTLLAKETMTTTLKPGRDINTSIRKAMGLSGEYLTDLTKQVPSDGSYYLRNFTFGRNKCSDQITAANTFKISTDESSPEAYLGVYKKDGYYYPCIWSETDIFIMNKDLSYMFAGLGLDGEQDINFADGYAAKDLDFHNVKNVSHYMHNTFVGSNIYQHRLEALTNLWVNQPIEEAESTFEGLHHYGNYSLYLNMSYINTDALKNTSKMFKDTNMQEIYIHRSKFDKVEDASSMFEGCSTNYFYVNDWTFENNKNFSKMFKNSYAYNFKNVNDKIRFNKAEDLSEMFMGADISDALFANTFMLGGQKIVNMESMYEDYKKPIYVELENLNTAARPANIKNMFKNSKVVSVTLPKIIDTTATTDMSSLFENCTNLNTLKNFDQIDTDNVTNMSKMFYNTASLHYVDQIAKTIKANKVTDMSYMFYHARAGGPVEFNNEFNTSTVKSMKAMFAGFSRVDVNISHFRFDNLEDMSRMFKGVFEELTADSKRDHYIGRADSYSYGVSDVIWPTRHSAPKLETMARLFQSNRFIRKVKAPSLNTPALKDLSWAFYGIGSFNEFDVTGLETSNVEDFSHIFALNEEGFKNFENIKLNFNTSKATNLQEIFFYTWYPKNLDLSSWDTSNVTNMLECFGMTRNTVDELDLTGWNTAKVTNMDYFLYDSSIKKIWASDTFVTTSVTSASQPLHNANIIGQKGTNGYYGDYSYLRIDNAPTAPGIFWKKS